MWTAEQVSVWLGRGVFIGAVVLVCYAFLAPGARTAPPAIARLNRLMSLGLLLGSLYAIIPLPPGGLWAWAVRALQFLMLAAAMMTIIGHVRQQRRGP